MGISSNTVLFAVAVSLLPACAEDGIGVQDEDVTELVDPGLRFAPPARVEPTSSHLQELAEIVSGFRSISINVDTAVGRQTEPQSQSDMNDVFKRAEDYVTHLGQQGRLTFTDYRLRVTRISRHHESVGYIAIIIVDGLGGSRLVFSHDRELLFSSFPVDDEGRFDGGSGWQRDAVSTFHSVREESAVAEPVADDCILAAIVDLPDADGEPWGTGQTWTTELLPPILELAGEHYVDLFEAPDRFDYEVFSWGRFGRLTVDGETTLVVTDVGTLWPRDYGEDVLIATQILDDQAHFVCTYLSR